MMKTKARANGWRRPSENIMPGHRRRGPLRANTSHERRGEYPGGVRYIPRAPRSVLAGFVVSLDRGAPLPVWGGGAYDARAGWVVVGEHAGRQRLERLGGRSPLDAKE